MQATDVNSLFARAERAFVEGRIDAARADLAQVSRLAGEHAAVLHLLALVEKKGGDLVASKAAFERALALAPNDAQINNNYANLLDAAGERDKALLHFDRALAAAPGFADARYNRALLLQRMERYEEALAELDRITGPAAAKVHSARGSLLRQLGRLPEAGEAYDEALRLEPKRLTALHGRARVAMERGEPTASLYYGHALALKPADLELRLGFAEALEAEGEAMAVESLGAVVAGNPGWVEGQSVLARMRWEAGEGRAFTRDFEQALERTPNDRALWMAYASSLAAADLYLEAADAAAKARAHTGDHHNLMLLEAVHASEAGELDRADGLFERMPDGATGRSGHEIRHRIRRGQLDRAMALADKARAEEPWDVSAWAMTGLLWRLLGDDRAVWLHEQPGLVARRQLDLSASAIDEIAECLRGLHKTRAHPIGQSLRGGTQTRGRLFERDEPEVRELRGAIERAVASYWSELPPFDPTHPLLRHRNGTPKFDGSWSVRLTDGGFHVAHVHPNGVLSSACYLAVPPPAGEPKEGWLEVGRPPAGLKLDLGPLVEVEPVRGRLALFPSTLFHGTRRFSAGERLTAAFDVVAS